MLRLNNEQQQKCARTNKFRRLMCVSKSKTKLLADTERCLNRKKKELKNKREKKYNSNYLCSLFSVHKLKVSKTWKCLVDMNQKAKMKRTKQM